MVPDLTPVDKITRMSVERPFGYDSFVIGLIGVVPQVVDRLSRDEREILHEGAWQVLEQIYSESHRFFQNPLGAKSLSHKTEDIINVYIGDFLSFSPVLDSWKNLNISQRQLVAALLYMETQGTLKTAVSGENENIIPWQEKDPVSWMTEQPFNSPELAEFFVQVRQEVINQLPEIKPPLLELGDFESCTSVEDLIEKLAEKMQVAKESYQIFLIGRDKVRFESTFGVSYPDFLKLTKKLAADSPLAKERFLGREIVKEAETRAGLRPRDFYTGEEEALKHLAKVINRAYPDYERPPLYDNRFISFFKIHYSTLKYRAMKWGYSGLEELLDKAEELAEGLWENEP